MAAISSHTFSKETTYVTRYTTISTHTLSISLKQFMPLLFKYPHKTISCAVSSVDLAGYDISPNSERLQSENKRLTAFKPILLKTGFKISRSIRNLSNTPILVNTYRILVIVEFLSENSLKNISCYHWHTTVSLLFTIVQYTQRVHLYIYTPSIICKKILIFPF